ncbi:DNA-3-methyladenine glycosylase I [Salidesulfovibrio brasiliensis]|uniref:DNA-3-methyladenine glycosylase I n=1 Tax=Salidesulfovibrio brasiliensis TaxID=221711 RepID=UPI0006CF2592|nr:DNA-3-methyladenine glycosylase I [Salidesulfovibrio brasiliensis]
MPERIRCDWALRSEEEILYHDTEWGVPVLEDRKQFEFLVLESAQAGLSWLTILRKREGYRRAFAGFDPEAVALFDERDVQRLMEDSGIIRNRRKIEATVSNARAFLQIQESFGSFCNYIWGFVNGRPVQNAFVRMEDVPPETELSRRIAKDLKQRGFKFLGPVTVYAHMQAAGLVNDHLVHCFRHHEIANLAR